MPAPLIWPTQFRSYVLLEDTSRIHFASIPAVDEETIVRLLDNTGLAMISNTDTKAIAVIHTVGNSSIDESFQSSAFQSAMERAFYKCLAELHAEKDVVTRAIDLLALWNQLPD